MAHRWPTGGLFKGVFGSRTGNAEAVQDTTIELKPPKNGKDGNRIICFRIDPELDRRLAKLLAANGVSRSQYIRLAIEHLLKAEADNRLRAAHSAITWD
jgi:predicted DNA-binding protein